jgi:hypothetical protein
MTWLSKTALVRAFYRVAMSHGRLVLSATVANDTCRRRLRSRCAPGRSTACRPTVRDEPLFINRVGKPPTGWSATQIKAWLLREGFRNSIMDE